MSARISSHLEYDQDSDRLLQIFSFNGTAFGVRFSFRVTNRMAG